MAKKRKILYVTGTRADFGLMSPVLKAINQNKNFHLTLYATGMHLMKQLGYSFSYVKKEFPETKKIKAKFNKDDFSGSALFTSALYPKIIEKFIIERPDIVLVLGDRPEMLLCAVACAYLHIPIAHIHGGEKSSTIDDTIRHAITKLANIHFPATEIAALRIKNMGEEPWRVHITGAPSLDVIKNEKLPSKKEMFKKLNFKFSEPHILVTLHPISQDWRSSGMHMDETMQAVIKMNKPTVVIYPNADAGSKQMIKVIEKYKNKNVVILPNVEYKFFLALERDALVWVGNSSAMIIESPSFKVPVVNVGPRQKGREQARNIVNALYNRISIYNAIKESVTLKKRKSLLKIKNPWGEGTASTQIVHVLKTVSLDDRLLQKQLLYE